MNQRIDQLWAQALDLAVPETYTQLSHSQVLKIKQVFADMIVRECARIIDRGDGGMSSMAETSWCNICRDDILKHFGIEE